MFASASGLPRWVLGFLQARRQKIHQEFANAIDVIVRSVKSGLPLNEALRLVARESPDPVGAEFTRLVDGLKVGVTHDQGLKKMHESMPPPKSISSASSSPCSQSPAAICPKPCPISPSCCATASGWKQDQGDVVGSQGFGRHHRLAAAGGDGHRLAHHAAYIDLLFTERVGNLMLLGCVLWMGTGILVMRKMINFKH